MKRFFGNLNFSVGFALSAVVIIAAGISLIWTPFDARFVDEAVMRFSDLLFGFPAVLTAILITSTLGPSMINAMLAIGIFYIPVFARLTRAVAITVYEREFITAARP